ncbi:MAG TPA: hypothetical protein DEH78_22750 [Solibacterales bacterium]|nr:hypothetical protein [Bryobacterales bacterium]
MHKDQTPPPRQIQELRDLTRYRVKLKGEYNRIHNRIARLLEDAHLKLGSAATDTCGVTGRKIMRASLAGEQRPEWLADKAMSTLRAKKDQLRLVLQGDFDEHRRFLLKELLDALELVSHFFRGCHLWPQMNWVVKYDG